MGRGTWYYSLGVSSIVDAFVRSEFGISSWRGSRVDGRSYLLSGAIDGSEANRIIRDSKMRNRHVEVYGYAFWVNLCTSGFHGVNEPGGVRVAREDNRGVTKGREDVREVFQQRGSRAKRKLSRRGRNQLSNEPILALPEGADDFVVYYDAQSKDLEACLEKKGEGRLWVVEGLTLERGHELKHNMIVLAKVRGDSKRGPEFTWERKDQMRSKCPQLFVDSANASSS
ncbi:hypothetical protein Tco_0774466 [Tanacetum coccineum]|uniref:Uncharacterized protein n=1 Tax=Tanacetum coccineum TaxID=301880 RepID=A0ABQ4ZNL6_9ASTR